MLCLRSFDAAFLANRPFIAKAADCALDSDWRTIYSATNLPECAISANDQCHPYFNSGFLSIDAGIVREFCRQWEANYRRLQASGKVTAQSYFHEQISMAITVQRMRLNYAFLPVVKRFQMNWKIEFLGQKA